MKKLVLALLAVGIVACAQLPNPLTEMSKKMVVHLEAASLPFTASFQWNPNPAGDNVTSYQVVVDGAAPVTIPLTACAGTPVICSTPVTLNALGAHTASVAAVNLTMSGDPGVVGSPQVGPASTLNLILNASPSKTAGLGAK